MSALDQSKLLAFYKTLSTLERTTQLAIDFLLQKITCHPPGYKELVPAIRLFKNMMATMEENVRITLPNFKQSVAKQHLCQYLALFQRKQALRHKVIVSLSEAVAVKSVTDELIQAYQETFRVSDQLNTQMEELLAALCEVVGMSFELLQAVS
jgi:hypothetical protein